MTLCLAWKANHTVHFASDSRLTIANNSYADVGIKVLSLPFNILEPTTHGHSGKRPALLSGEVGMCFAGSAINSLAIKESVAEVLKNLQYVPGYTDTSMVGIAGLVFNAYKIISKEICQTAIGSNGRANLIIGGMCQTTQRIRVFHLSTDTQNKYKIEEVLTGKNHFFIGQGADMANEDVPQNPTDLDYLDILKSAINDTQLPGVGGHIQYGCFHGSDFVVYGILENNQNEVHYWRGALDLNNPDFMQSKALIPGTPWIDPFRTISGD